MSRDADTIPVIIDTARGLVYSKWVVIGASADVPLWTPGEDRSWLVQLWLDRPLDFLSANSRFFARSGNRALSAEAG